MADWSCPVCDRPDLTTASVVPLPVADDSGHNQDDNPVGQILVCHPCLGLFLDAAWVSIGRSLPRELMQLAFWRWAPGHDHNERLIALAKAAYVAAGSPAPRKLPQKIPGLEPIPERPAKPVKKPKPIKVAKELPPITTDDPRGTDDTDWVAILETVETP